MRNLLQTTFIVTGALMLGACQSMGGNAQSLQAGIRVAEQPEPRAHAREQLVAGQQALAERNYAEAVVALRTAALDPDSAAEANNGLAIAYAGIGRNDLARRYFRLAIEQAPTVEKYHDNLVRLLRADLLAEQSRRERAQQPAAIPARPALARTIGGNSERAALRIETPSAGLVRLSPSSVTIQSPARPTQAAPRPRQAAAATVQLTPRVEPMAGLPAPIPERRPLEPRPAVVASGLRREPVGRVMPPEPTMQTSAAVAISTTGTRVPSANPASHTRLATAHPGAQQAGIASAIQATGLRRRELLAPLFGDLLAVERAGSLALSAIQATGLRRRELPAPLFGDLLAVERAESLALADW